MSDTYYIRQWLQTRKDLRKVLASDKALQQGKPIQGLMDAVNAYVDIYYRYRKVVQLLTDCHDQIVQPQIRDIVGRTLDYSIVRMLELRREIFNISYNDGPWPVEALLNHKLTPDDVALKAPAYDAGAKKIEFERRKKVVEDSLANAHQSDDELDESDEEESTSSQSNSTLSALSSDDGPPAVDQSLSTLNSRRRRSRMVESIGEVKTRETPQQKAAREAAEAEQKRVSGAMTLIQSHERARIGRRKAIEAARYNELATFELATREASKEDQNKAAIVIQRTWRDFAARRDAARRLAKVEKLLGMTIPYWSCAKALEQSERNFEERVDMQIDAVHRMEDTIKAEKEKIWESRGPQMVEDIRDEIREWFVEWFNELGVMDCIPSAEDGGTTLVATGQSRTPQEYLATLMTGKKKKEIAVPEPDSEDEEENDDLEGFTLEESVAFPFLEEIDSEFEERWSLRVHKIVASPGGLAMDLIRDELYHELQLDMRKLADESMRQELVRLNEALVLDHAGDDEFRVVTPEQFGDEEESGKKGLERARRRSRMSAEPDGEATEDELLLLLTRWKVLRQVEQRRLSEWPGATSYALKLDPELRLGDARGPVTDYCVMPMGSSLVHRLAPLNRSVCICGPPGAGQQFIAHAVCTELRATVFDLTPEKHVGRFMRKEAQNKLTKAVIKLAKAYAPSVVLVEGELAYWKRVPHELRRVRPERFAPIYSNIVKGIKAGDQVLFLMTSTRPSLAKRGLLKLHDKFVIVPCCDYGSAYLGYRDPLMRASRLVDRRFDVSCLARLTPDAPHELIARVVAGAVPLSRRLQLGRRPLQQRELMEQALAVDRRQEDVDEANKFRRRLPSEAKRRRLLEEHLAELRARELAELQARKLAPEGGAARKK